MNFTLRETRTTYATPLRISYLTKTHTDMLVLELEDGGIVGRGEALGVFYFDETPATMTKQLIAVRSQIERGLNTQDVASLLPPGGARNALNCALWDLECKRQGRRIWDLLGMPAPRRLRTAYTLSLDTPEA